MIIELNKSAKFSQGAERFCRAISEELLCPFLGLTLDTLAFKILPRILINNIARSSGVDQQSFNNCTTNLELNSSTITTKDTFTKDIILIIILNTVLPLFITSVLTAMAFPLFANFAASGPLPLPFFLEDSASETLYFDGFVLHQ